MRASSLAITSAQVSRNFVERKQQFRRPRARETGRTRKHRSIDCAARRRSFPARRVRRSGLRIRAVHKRPRWWCGSVQVGQPIREWLVTDRHDAAYRIQSFPSSGHRAGGKEGHPMSGSNGLMGSMPIRDQHSTLAGLYGCMAVWMLMPARDNDNKPSNRAPAACDPWRGGSPISARDGEFRD